MKNKRSGLTYMECLLALTIGSLIILMSYDTLRQGLHATQSRFANDKQEKIINVAFALLAKDLRHATFSIDQRHQIFVGRQTGAAQTHLQFYRTSNKREDDDKSWAVNYKLEQNQLTRNLQTNQGSKRTTFLAAEVQTFQVRYFNGQRWSDTWNWDEQNNQPTFGIRGLPLLVSVTLKIKGVQRKMKLPLLVPLMNESLHV